MQQVKEGGRVLAVVGMAALVVVLALVNSGVVTLAPPPSAESASTAGR